MTQCRMFFRLLSFSVCAFMIIQWMVVVGFAADLPDPVPEPPTSSASSELFPDESSAPAPETSEPSESESSSSEVSSSEPSSEVSSSEPSSESSSDVSSAEESSSLPKPLEIVPNTSTIYLEDLSFNPPDLTIEKAIFQIRFCAVFFIFGLVPLGVALLVVWLFSKWVYGLIVHSV